MADDDQFDEHNPDEDLCGSFVDDVLTDSELDQLVRRMLVDSDLRQELHRQLLLHDALKEIARRGWED
ncbi:hypothetical protein NG895_14830 [Aeoliella sp. ICT_H6.2]|uniref:Uncharacterized protein n=1 Tax=Aeoliella straminimaris TaxID=2954799 RepID=A0A9X2FF84_9BACT|nr:hypothetical protein [Aeoliella straminimaris]MCO6045184.1 hypothetical protein [Aeoliella straminimaris]